MQDVIRMTYDVALCHPDEITKMWSLSHPDDLAIPSISSGWLIVNALCHPDDLPGVGISSGWVTANSLCHPDDILFHFMSSGWLNWSWFLIRMSYGNVIMSSGSDTLPFLSHPDEIANFDFPQHAVALQRFRIIWLLLFTFYTYNSIFLHRYLIFWCQTQFIDCNVGGGCFTHVTFANISLYSSRSMSFSYSFMQKPTS